MGAAIGFLISIAHNPQLPALSLARSLGASPAHVLRRSVPAQEAARQLAEVIRRDALQKPIPSAAALPGQVTGPVRAAFYVNYDKPSLDSLAHHVGALTHFCPTWLFLTTDGANVVYNDGDSPVPAPLSTTRYVGPTEPNDADQNHAPSNDAEALRLARRAGVAILPVVQNAGEDDFHAEWLHRLLASPAHRAAVIAQLLAFVQDGHFQGINVDFETDKSADRANLTQFMAALSAQFHARNLLVTEDVQTDSDAYALPALARLNDFLVPMLYDQHGDGTPAGPIAGQDWFQTELRGFLAQVPADKTVLGVGNYGYDWTGKGTSVNELSFESAARLAQESQQSGDGDDGIIRLDPQSLNPTFTYYDEGAGAAQHTVWLMDATTTLNQMRAALPAHTLGAALWRLGEEDPSLWSFFGKGDASRLASFNPQDLSSVTYSYFGTQFEGEGDVLDVVQPPTPGLRQITAANDNGLVTGEKFLRYPSQFVVRRTGLVDQTTGKNTAKAIALTFDDGPDPRWTPQILDILRRERVPATFFVVGKNAEAHPGLLAREWQDGMEIGNHSFTHPEESIKPLRWRLELDATQRVIEAMTGHMTLLFRAPNRAELGAVLRSRL